MVGKGFVITAKDGNRAAAVAGKNVYGGAGAPMQRAYLTVPRICHARDRRWPWTPFVATRPPAEVIVTWSGGKD